LQEAQTLLPVLESLLRRARSTALKAGEIEAEMQRLSHRIFLAGGMHVDIAAAARRRAELCWKLGETAIAHWHEPEAGPEDRQPLDGGFGKSERERLN
jgi:hypothetical protein